MFLSRGEVCSLAVDAGLRQVTESVSQLLRAVLTVE